MAKHDKENAYKADIPSDEYYRAKIKQLESELAFANETVSKLRDENAKYGRWVNSMDANAQDIIAEKDAEIEKWKAKALGLVEAYV